MGRRRKKLAGREFGRLTVSTLSRRSLVGRIEWFCKCRCGNQLWVRSSNLLTGNSKSCGKCEAYGLDDAMVEQVSV